MLELVLLYLDSISIHALPFCASFVGFHALPMGGLGELVLTMQVLTAFLALGMLANGEAINLF
jgi:hypothetical protein